MLRDEIRHLIYENYFDLDKISSLRKNPLFLTPTSLHLNQDMQLEAATFPFIDALNMHGIKKRCYMTKQYLSIINNMIKIIKDLTNKGVVITDLKLANMLVTSSSKVIIVDNDFSIRSQNHEMLEQVTEINKNIYMRNYRQKFASILDENYNRYMLLNILGLLLLENDSLEKVWPRGAATTYSTLKEINRQIQTDRSIPMTFKKNFSTILTGNSFPDVTDNTIEEYKEVVLKKIKKRQKGV